MYVQNIWPLYLSSKCRATGTSRVLGVTQTFFFKFGIPGTAVSDISLYKIFIEEWDLCGCVDEDKCIASTSLVSGNARVTADCCRHYVFGLFVCLSACVHTCVCVSGQRHSPICLLSTSSCLPGVHSGWPPNLEYMEKPGNLRLV